MKKRRVVNVSTVGGDATATGIGGLGVLFIIWALTEYGHRKLS